MELPAAVSGISIRRARRVKVHTLDEDRELPRTRRLGIGGLSIIVVLGVWQILASTRTINPLIDSSPYGVIRAFGTLVRSGQLQHASIQSAGLFGAGFGLSLVSGIVLGVLLGWYRPIDAAVDPFVSILYAVPRIALIPVITVLTGQSFFSQIVIVWTTAVFPIIINVAVGVRSTDRQLLAVAYSFRSSSLQVLKTVALPGAIPAIVAGIRQGVALALIGVVVAEYFVGNNGVGGMIVDAGQLLNTDTAFVGVLVFAAAALVLTAVLRRVEQRVDHWRV